MKDFTLAEIAKACNGEYVGDESLKNTKITSVERDSRQVKNGSLFLAIKGERVDGHDFIEKCFAQGAVCALCEKAPENATKPCIVVPSTLDAVKKIGKAYRDFILNGDDDKLSTVKTVNGKSLFSSDLMQRTIFTQRI